MTYQGFIRVTIPIVVLLALMVNGALAYTIYVGDDSVEKVGDETIIPVVLSSAPDTSIWYYNLTISIDNASVAEITEVQFPDWADTKETTPSTFPCDICPYQGGNLLNTSLPSIDNVVLADIVVKGLAEGESWITIDSPSVEWKNGTINPGEIYTISGSITVGGPSEPLVADFTAENTTGSSFPRRAVP